MREKLFIYEFDDVLLPNEHHFNHNFCVRLYDDLIHILKDETIEKKTTITIKLKPHEMDDFKNTEQSVEWLIKNGYKNEADKIISNNLILGVISDFCFFLYQALFSAKHMNMVVAFSLIRKPFLENLLIVEQLLLNEKKFLRKLEGEPENFDPGSVKNEDKIHFINNCINKIRSIHILDSNLIYTLRYDKKNSQSFYAASNIATHLVTTRHSSFRTDKNNLNFIFSDFDDWEVQLNYFYYYVPYVLLYSVEVIYIHLLEKNLIDPYFFKKRKFIRLLCQLLVFYEQEENDEANSKLTKALEGFNVICTNCRKENCVHISDIFSLVQSDCILCKHCLTDLINGSNSFDKLIEELFNK